MPARGSRRSVEAAILQRAGGPGALRSALAAQPLLPVQFTLYFVDGKDEFTDESKLIVDSVFAEIARRPVPDVIVIGHTDSVGNDAANDLLSRQRAEVARNAFVARGLAADKVVHRRPRQARAGSADRRRRLRAAQPARRDPGALRLRSSRGGPHRAADAAARPRRTAPAQGQDRDVVVRLGAVAKARTSARSAVDEVARLAPRPTAVDEDALRPVGAVERAGRVLGFGDAVGHDAQLSPGARRQRGAAPGVVAGAQSGGPSPSTIRRAGASPGPRRYGLSWPALQ